MKCSVQFFDNTSFGQIINRFSTDVEVIDKVIKSDVYIVIHRIHFCYFVKLTDLDGRKVTQFKSR